jgi:predicted nucleic acid-binding protein
MSPLKKAGKKKVKIVFNSSPLIFLSRLDFLNQFLEYDYQFLVPQIVIEEINAKQDEASRYVNNLITNKRLTVKQISLFSLANSLGDRLGRGEAEAITLATELQSDYLILDDFAARKEAIRLGLNVKGTLAIIRKMSVDGKINIDNLEQLYQQLLKINFRVRRELIDAIFTD